MRDFNAQLTNRSMSEHPKLKNLGRNAKLVVAGTTTFAAPLIGMFFFLQSSRWAPAVVVLSIGLALLGLVVGDDPGSFAAALSPVGIAVLFAAYEARRPDPSLIALIPLGMVAMVGIYIPIMCSFPSYFPLLFGMIRSNATLEQVRWLMILSQLAWGFGATGLFGTSTSLERRLAEILRFQAEGDDVPKPFLVVGFAALAVSTAAYGVGYMSQGRVPAALAQFLAVVGCVYYVGFYGHASAMFRSGKASPTTMGWIALALFFDIISGSKGRFFTFTLLPLSAAFSLSVKHVSSRGLATFVTIVLVSALVGYPLLANYRSDLADGRTSVGDAGNGLMAASERLDEGYVDRALTPILQSNTAEQAMAIASVVHFDVRRPTEPYVQRLLFFWVPRAIWPDKPIALSGNEIGRETGRVNEGDLETSVLTTSLGDLYIHFGLYGSLLLCAGGLVIRLLERTFCPNPMSDPLQCGMWVYLGRSTTMFVAGVYESVLTGAIQEAVLLAGLMVLTRWLQKTQPTRAAIQR